MPVVLVEKESPQISVITLNRPERRNALTLELLTELCAAIKAASEQTEQRLLIFRGAGAAFCTGLDLKDAADTTKAHATAEMVANTLVAISQTRLVTIAAVHGAAVAGGAGIMSACDFVVAAERTKIGYPEVRRGLVAGLVMTFLRRQIGERNMRELLFSGELIDAARAKEIGLVNRVVAPEDVMSEAQKIRCVGSARRTVRAGANEATSRGALVAFREGRRRSRAEISHAGARIGRSPRRHLCLQRKAQAKLGEIVAQAFSHMGEPIARIVALAQCQCSADETSTLPARSSQDGCAT